MEHIQSGKAADRDGNTLSVLILMSGLSVGSQLAAGLAARGAATAVVSDQAPCNGKSGEKAAGQHSASQNSTPVHTPCDFSSKDQISHAIKSATRGQSSPDLIVIGVVPGIALASSPLETHSDETDWRLGCLAGLKTTLHCLQACHGVVANSGGIVLIGPNFSFTGAAGLVALSTLTEGQRALAKSAARQWGPAGVRVNWLALAPGQLAASLMDASLPEVPELGPPPLPLGSAAGWEDGVADTLMFLAGAGGKAMTGMSLNLDGGEWMVP